jgi:hypothetical protein
MTAREGPAPSPIRQRNAVPVPLPPKDHTQTGRSLSDLTERRKTECQDHLIPARRPIAQHRDCCDKRQAVLRHIEACNRQRSVPGRTEALKPVTDGARPLERHLERWIQFEPTALPIWVRIVAYRRFGPGRNKTPPSLSPSARPPRRAQLPAATVNGQLSHSAWTNPADDPKIGLPLPVLTRPGTLPSATTSSSPALPCPAQLTAGGFQQPRTSLLRPGASYAGFGEHLWLDPDRAPRGVGDAFTGAVGAGASDERLLESC